MIYILHLLHRNIQWTFSIIYAIFMLFILPACYHYF